MKIKLNKKEVHIVETKTATFDNGVVCKYTLTNDAVTAFKFEINKMHLYAYIPESTDVNNLEYNNFFKHFEKFELKTEDDIIAFQDKVHRLYHINDGMLMDCNGEYVSIKLPLTDMYYAFMHRNDRDNIEVLANFIREHDEFDIVCDIVIDEVPYYNQHDLDDDEDYFTQFRLTTWIRIKDQKTILENVCKSSIGKNNTYFNLSRYVDKMAREFAIKYPHMKEYRPLRQMSSETEAEKRRSQFKVIDDRNDK